MSTRRRVSFSLLLIRNSFFFRQHIWLTQFTVIGAREPVVAIVGQDTVLPCHLSPRMSATNMEVRWFRSKIFSFVHLYRDGTDQYEGQMPEYRRRTALSKAGLTDGNVDLRILSIRPSDEGQYRCFVQDNPFYEETILELRAAAVGSDPLISVEGHQDGGILVVCRSAGWYPEPEVLWKDLTGRHLPSLSEKKSQGENSLFETETAIIVKEQSNQNLSCCVRNTVLSQEKKSAVYISDGETHGRICPTTLRDLTLSSVCWAVRDSPQGDIAGRWRVGDGGVWGWPESLCGGRDGSALALRGGSGLCSDGGDQFRALTSPVTPLPQSRVPSRIRVCLDCDRGQVTFFGAGDEAPIFTFPPGSVPGERIRPWLWVWDRNTRLRLCP
uniref:Ig-like domain-containing protein n=1 Tax=Pelusios castaneus TaxID=367368 RepID=A0A8C8SHZ3_9SAUR